MLTEALMETRYDEIYASSEADIKVWKTWFYRQKYCDTHSLPRPKDKQESVLADDSGLIYVNMASHVLIQMLQNVKADYLWE